MRSCSTVNIPLAIKIKPQMVIDYQQYKKQLEKERARIEAERLAEESQTEEQQGEAAEGEENTQSIES